MQNTWRTPLFSQYGYCSNYRLSTPYTVFDQYQYGGCWIQPRQYVYHIYEQRRPCFEAKKLSKRGGRYYMTERNSREVHIGAMDISNVHVVNPRDDGSFDCILCEFQGEGMQEKRTCQFPLESIRKHNPLPYIPDFHRNPDCPTRYIIAAFFEELFSNNEIKFLNLPPHSGWNLLGDRWCFVSTDSMIPQLAEYYAPDIPLRQMQQTDKTLSDAAAELAALLPDSDACRELLTANVSSILLGFYEEHHHKPDRVIVVMTDSEQGAKLATVLLKNRNFTDTYASSLLESKTMLTKDHGSIWDGTVISRDSSYVERKKRRDAGLDVSQQELHRGQGINETSRKIITIVTDNPAAYSAEFPAVFIDMRGCPEVENLEELQQTIGTFLTALIKTLEQSDVENNLVSSAIKRTPHPEKTVENCGEIGLETIMRCTAKLLSELGLFDDKQISQLEALFCRSTEAAFDLNRAVVNDFRSVLSAMIENGEVGVANQFAPPYYIDPPSMVMIDDGYVNLTTEVMNHAVARLHLTQRRNTVLRALTAEDKLHATNNCKRLLEFEIAPGCRDDRYFYSVPRTMLTPSCQTKLEEIRHADFLFSRREYPKDFVPILRCGNGLAAGRVIGDDTDEAESIYASGKARSGKTHFLLQQAIIRAAAGHRMIVFDQTGAFAQNELRKHLTEDIIRDFFSHWELGEQGIPVNLLCLENCKSPSDKKQRLVNVFSVLARLTGEIQLKNLRSCLTKVIHAIEAGQVHVLADALRFFNKDDPDQAEIANRLKEAFEDIEGLPESRMTWGDFIASQNRIIVISTASDGIRKSSQFIDALLASLYAWKQWHRTERMTVVLDELEDLCLEKDGPIDTILRKAGKHRLSMMMASQEYSSVTNRLGKLIGNCGLQVFFLPKDACIVEISQKHGIDRQQLATLEQGQCFVVGGFYSRLQGKNKHSALRGAAFSAEEFLTPPKQPQVDTDVPAEAVSDEESMLPELQELSDSPRFISSQYDPEQADTDPEAVFPETQDPSVHLEAISDLDDIEPELTSLEPEYLPSDPATDTQMKQPPIVPESYAQEPAKDNRAESTPETGEHPIPSEQDSDTSEENTQKLIERELQQQFRDIIRQFNPDHPCWPSMLTDFFKMYLEQHHFTCQSEHDSMLAHLQQFMYFNPDRFDYRKHLEALFHELWHSA